MGVDRDIDSAEVVGRLRAALLATDVPSAHPGLPCAAVAVLLRPAPDGLELFLIRRAEHPGDLWSGHVALPGGRVDPSDVDLVHTARRETLEEVSIDLEHAEYLGSLDPTVPMSEHAPRIAVYPFVWVVPADVEADPNEEVDAARWVSLEWLRSEESATSISIDVPALGQRVELPGIAVGERVLWGITHRIVMSLFAAMEPGHA